MLLERNFSSHFTDETDGNTEIELSILEYGLNITREYNLSFNFETEIRVKHEDGIIFQDFIYWREDKPSADLPPPRSEHVFNLAEAILNLMHVDQARAGIKNLLSREDVQGALIAQGINPMEAKARIDSLSDARLCGPPIR